MDEFNWSGLSAFRDTLPEYRRKEHFCFFVVCWDIVRVQYLLSKKPRETHNLLLENAPKVYGFENPAGSLYRFDPKAHEDERIDLSRPVIMARIAIDDGGEPETLVIDGINRIYKGWKLGHETLPLLVLEPEEEMLCRTR